MLRGPLRPPLTSPLVSLNAWMPRRYLLVVPGVRKAQRSSQLPAWELPQRRVSLSESPLRAPASLRHLLAAICTPPSPRRRIPRRGQSPLQVRPPSFAFRPGLPRVGPRILLAISFFATNPQPSGPAPLPALPQTPRRFRRRGSPPGRQRHPKTDALIPPAFHPSPSLSAARRSTHPSICSQTPAPEKNSPVAEKSPQPFRWLSLAPIRRFRCPRASPHIAPLRASLLHKRDASGSVQNPLN